MKINLLNVKLDTFSKKQAIEKIDQLIQKKSPSIIATVNVEFLMRAQTDNDFMKFLNQKTSMNLVDGWGVIWGAKIIQSKKPTIPVIKQIYVFLQWFLTLIFLPLTTSFYKNPIPEKVSGSDFIFDIAKYAAENKKRIFLIGNKLGLDPNSVEKASLKLQTDVYDLKISGYHSIIDPKKEGDETAKMIKKSAADIVLIGLGSPTQEFWLADNLKKSGAKIGIGLGGTFDFITGAQKRAPKIFQKTGLEWLYRLIRQPNRFRRQIALPKYAYRVLLSRLS